MTPRAILLCSTLLGGVIGATAGFGVSVVGAPHAVASGPNADVDPPGVQTADTRVVRAAGHGHATVRELAHGKEAWLGILTLDAEVAVPEHQDSTEEFIHVLSGAGTITIDGTATPVGPGDTVYMPAGATVSYTNGAAPLRAVQVFAGPAPASKYDGWSPVAE